MCNSFKNSFKTIYKTQRGTLTVEFALILPVIVIFLGIISLFINWAIISFKINSLTGEIARAAIVSENINSEIEQNNFKEIIARHLSQRETAQLEYEIEYVDKNGEKTIKEDVDEYEWVNVHFSENTKNGPLGIFIGKIESQVIGKIEK